MPTQALPRRICARSLPSILSVTIALFGASGCGDDGGGTGPGHTIAIELADGRRIEEPTARQLGAPENPLPPRALRAKFDELAGLVLPRGQADELAETVLRLDAVRDASILLPLLRARTS